jgi:Flp pilus assembly pilin Flp
MHSSAGALPVLTESPWRVATMNLFVLRTWLEAKFGKDEDGASMVEYILLVALIALAVIAAVVFLKDQVNGKFNDAGSKLSSSGS